MFILRQAFSTFLVSPGGPQLNTPILPTCGRQEGDSGNRGLFLMRRGRLQTHLWVNVLQRVEKGQKWWSAKVGDGSEASEEAAIPHLLEVALAHILQTKGKIKETPLVRGGDRSGRLTSMVVRRSNFSATWVMYVWTETSSRVSISSTSLMMSDTHSNWRCVRVTQMK